MNPFGGKSGPERTLESAVERIFPSAPWPIRPGYVGRRGAIGALVLALGVILAAYYAQASFEDFQQLARERALWPDAVASAPRDSVETTATVRFDERNTKWILYVTELEVSFDVEGVTRTRQLQLQTLLDPLDPKTPALVRFDRNHPEHWALNWAVEAKQRRIGAMLFMGVGGALLVGGSIGFLGYALWVGADRVRRVAQRGITIAAEVTEVVEQTSYGRSTGAFIYRFRMPAYYGGKRREAVFYGDNPRPLLLLGGKYLVVCILAKDPDVFVVPREDLSPFEFAEEVRSRIRERARTVAAHFGA